MLHDWVQKYIDGQYRQPSGVVGRWIGGKMADQHRPENQWTVTRLNVQPTDHLLEVGFGPGIAIAEVAKQAVQGYVAGVDYSRTMVAAARRRNAAAIRAGRIKLEYGDAAKLPFESGTFDKAYSIHSIYFWPRPLDALTELQRVLKPGGMLVMTVLPKERWGGSDPDAQIGTPDCTPYTGDAVQGMMVAAGFGTTRIEADTHPEHASNYSIIGLV